MTYVNHRTFYRHALVLAMLLGSGTVAAHADTLTVVSNVPDWQQSTSVFTTNADTEPWPGVTLADIPSLATFTLTPVAQNTAADSIPGATDIFSGSSVRFFRTEFLLPQFTDMTVDLRTSVDNSINIFVNGIELALYGPLNGFGGGPLGLTIASDGTVTNSAVRPFTEVAPTFNGFQSGSNEIILAVRNLNGGDGGGFTFRSDLTFTPVVSVVPETNALWLVATALPVLGVLIARRRPRRAEKRNKK